MMTTLLLLMSFPYFLVYYLSFHDFQGHMPQEHSAWNEFCRYKDALLCL